MADVLTVADLELAKKHDTFHSEVITGRAGGSASGSEIDTATNAVTGQVQTTLPKVLRDIGFKPASFTFVTGGTLGVADADKCIYNPAPAGDDNWYSWGGALPHVVSPGTDPTLPGSGYTPRTDTVLRAELAGDNGATHVQFKPSGISAAIKRGMDDFIYDQIIDVKWFLAKGDWNMGTQTGTDDTAAIQSALTYFATLGSRRDGVKRALKFPIGHYKYSTLTIPAGISFGLDIIGDGENSTYLWADHTNVNPAFNCEIEFVKFSNLTMMGSLSDQNSGNSSLWKSAGFKGKLSSNLADIDVKFENCGIYFWQDFAQIYGRGCVFDNCSIGFVTNVMNIVASADTVFTPGSGINSAQTGMRHYTFRNNRFDVVSRAIKITGTAAQKDYINDILFSGNDFSQLEVLIDGADATIRRVNITGNNAIFSFFSGMIQVKAVAGCSITATNAAKKFDDSTQPATAADCIESIVITTGSIEGLTINGNHIKNLRGNAVTAGAASKDVKIIGNHFDNAWVVATQTNHFVFYSGVNCDGLIVDQNSFRAGTISGNYHLWNESAQTSANSVFGNNTASWTWVDARVAYTPKLLVNGVQSAATPTSAHGRFTADDTFVYVDVMLVIDPTETTGNLSISLPSVTALPENNTITGSYAGGGLVLKSSGFTSAGNVFAPIQVNPVTQEAELWKEGGMVKARVTAADTSGAVLIAASFKYRH